VWADQLESSGDNIIVNCVHPGWVDTPGLQNAKDMSGFYKFMSCLGALRTEYEGADTAIWLATAPFQKVCSNYTSHDEKLVKSTTFKSGNF